MSRPSQQVTIVGPYLIEPGFRRRDDVYGVTSSQVARRRQFPGHEFDPLQQSIRHWNQLPDLVFDIIEEQRTQPDRLSGGQRSFADIAVEHTRNLCDTQRRRVQAGRFPGEDPDLPSVGLIQIALGNVCGIEVQLQVLSSSRILPLSVLAIGSFRKSFSRSGIRAV